MSTFRKDKIMAVAGSLTYDTKLDSKGFEKGLNSLESTVNKTVGNVVKAVAAISAAIGGITVTAIKSYADLEQNIGGVETLFKSSADKVKKYAQEAYKTAGMSANKYMETVTGFSASLLQSLGGDTDMADNSNKMRNCNGIDTSSLSTVLQNKITLC